MKRCGLLLLALSLVFGAMSLAALSSVRAGASQNTPVSASTKTATSNLSDDQLAAAKAPPCQKDWLCEAVPCATAPSCGVIEAGPMTDLGPNQYVYVNLYGFAPQTSVQLYYCKDTASLSTPARCPLSSSQLMQNPFTILTTMDDGTSSYGFQVVEADPGGAAFVHYLGLHLRIEILRQVAHDAQHLALPGRQAGGVFLDEIQQVFLR